MPSDAPAHGYDFVVVANRLPVDVSLDDDGEPTWTRSPGGLVTALAPVMASTVRRVGRLGRFPRPRAGAVRRGRHRADPGGADRGRPGEVLRGLLQRHPLAALPRRHRAAGVPPPVVGLVPEGEPALRAGGRRPGRAGRDGVGARLPAAAGPQDAPGAAARPAHRVLPPHPVPAAGAVRAAAVARAGDRGAARCGPRRLPAGRRRGELRAHRASAHGPHDARADGHAVRGRGAHRARPARARGGVPHLDRLARVRRAGPHGRRPRARRCRSVASWATPSSCCSASTASTTPRASGTASRPTASCCWTAACPRRARRSCRWPARAGRTSGAYQQLRDDVELLVGRINGDYGQVGHAPVQYLHQSFPMEEMAALYLAADVMLVTAAARRHEPGGQGVRRGPVRRPRRARALRVHRRRRRAHRLACW